MDANYLIDLMDDPDICDLTPIGVQICICPSSQAHRSVNGVNCQARQPIFSEKWGSSPSSSSGNGRSNRCCRRALRRSPRSPSRTPWRSLCANRRPHFRARLTRRGCSAQCPRLGLGAAADPSAAAEQDWAPAGEEAENERGNLDSGAGKPRPPSCR